ncbi:XRE family transcriptional regulator [Sphingomonas koreensis]|uniref:XRE family transcriptional regulator n=1 Tax=Sphingomonas koreensis TaxID=93064 RepID=A0A430G097_9SPHN|nr:helix-turn-helix transcriptional regulator [Sphingomonas koreensis]RSY79355.1 XRE family transcriptional regulator [Sphingomonas koreensis]
MSQEKRALGDDQDAESAVRQPAEDICASTIGATMRMVRKFRKLRAADIARDMDMPLRSYEYLESGKGRVSFERVMSFARATDVDGWALLASVPMGSPEFALRCADNKLMTILLVTMKELEEELGNDLKYLQPGTLIGAFSRLSKDLVQHVRKRDQYAELWLSEKSSLLETGIRDRRKKTR